MRVSFTPCTSTAVLSTFCFTGCSQEYGCSYVLGY
uniref:Uncharacterized protein n=1 Tax=Arundo donax TaxID=35708 RepID=A0A0A9FAI8_ARUDO